MTAFNLFYRRGDIYLAYNATVVGDVSFGKDCNFWFGTVVRGDIASITFGERVNIQDLSMVHCDKGVPQTIEDEVVAGHRVILHGKRVGRRALIGMGAVLLRESEIGEEAMVAAGSIVPPGMIVAPRTLVMGVPAKVVRQVTAKELEDNRDTVKRYLAMAREYTAGRAVDDAPPFLWAKSGGSGLSR